MKISISNLRYLIKKNKYFWMIARLISVVTLFGIFLWSNQKFFASHQVVNLCPPLGICFIILGAIAATVYIVEPMIVRSILRLKGLKMITDDTNRRIISQNTIVEQDEDYYCLRVKAGDKWEIIKLSPRMKKSDRPDYLKDDDDTMD